MQTYQQWKNAYYYGPVRAVWTIEAQQDLRAFHNLGAEAELAAVMAKEINAEIDREIIGNICENAELQNSYRI